MFGMGIGAVMGCGAGAYFQAYHTVFHSFIFCALVAFIAFIGSFFLPDELELNE
jgi:hypothetical protein